MRVIIQISRIQFRKDNVFFVYLTKRHNDLWRRLKERGIPVIIRIEVPENELR